MQCALHGRRVEAEDQRVGQQQGCDVPASVVARPEVVDQGVQQVRLAAVGVGVPGEHGVVGEEIGLLVDGRGEFLRELGVAVGDQRKVLPGRVRGGGEHVTGEACEESVAEVGV